MKLYINKTIGNPSNMERWMFGCDDQSFSDIKAYLDFMTEFYPEDNRIDVEIHSCGGDCTEGYAIYDALRTSGKELTCTVVGVAASMATVILLAAPKEKRFAYEHAQLLIHSPYIPEGGAGELTIDKAEAVVSMLKSEKQKMLSLYVDRTEGDATAIEEQMNAGSWFGAHKAMELGFIAGIVPATSAHKAEDIKVSTAKSDMKKEKATIAQAFKMLGEALGLTGSAEEQEVVSLELTTATGDTINIEREEGEPQVGDQTDASEGEVTLEDGRILVIDADGIITEIKEAEEEGTTEENELEALKKQVNDLQEQLNQANAKVAQLNKLTSKGKVPVAPQAQGKTKPEGGEPAKVSRVSAMLQEMRKK
jgi:ATP-dependent Clp protease protease subunit